MAAEGVRVLLCSTINNLEGALRTELCRRAAHAGSPLHGRPVEVVARTQSELAPVRTVCAHPRSDRCTGSVQRS